MKEQNVLVFRDYAIKIGDFGISFKLKNDNEHQYNAKGYTPGY